MPAALVVLAAALTLYAYRELPGRPFAADDYQWLLHVRGLSLGEVAARAFDAGAQTHFFRPMVWLLFWAQVRAFGLAPQGFHAVSLALHLLNSTLLAFLAVRLAQVQNAKFTMQNRLGADWSGTVAQPPRPLCTSHFARCILLVALHPAPFEAVVWASAQSELLAAALLLVVLHLWLPAPGARLPPLVRVLLATLALGLALLAKESAVIGLPLLLLLGPPLPTGCAPLRRWAPFVLPLAVTAAYLALQQDILARNEVIRGAGYGLGPQLLLNPLRTLGLVAAPLPGTEHGDAPWLPWAGAALVGLWVLDLALLAARRHPFAACSLRLGLAVLLTLLPTAPFTSPPDSRYVYLPVLAVAALLGARLAGRRTADGGRRATFARGLRPVVGGLALLALAWWAAGEIAAREGRFAAASGPGGSLWRLAQAECAAARPARIIVVEPPLAPPHAEAIVRLACGDEVLPLVVGRDGVADALRPNALVVAFPGGGAQVEQRAPNAEH